MQKDEVIELYKAIVEGRIDGSTYTGDCACFVGTIANIKNTDKNSLTVTPNSESPTEKFFLGISKGDTPKNNQVSKIVSEWTEEFMLANDLKIPTLTMVWA
jgi:hypothetical protein